MISWLRDLHWSLYYEHGIRWLSKPPKREWHVLLLDGMEPPPPPHGYTQVVTRMPSGLCEAGHHHALGACPVHQPLQAHPLYALRQMSQQAGSENPLIRDLLGF